MRSPEGLARRVLTAAALLGVFVAALLWLERRAFAVLVAAVLALAAHEWARLSGLSRRSAVFYAVGLAALFGFLVWVASAGLDARDVLLAVATAFWLLLAPAWLYLGITRASRATLAVAGAGVLCVAGLAVLALPAGLLLLVLGMVWIADTAAYFAGSAFGRHRLAPSISPGKTWEGVAAALVATLVYAMACALLVPTLLEHVQGWAWVGYLALVGLLCGVSVLGDLFESGLKRRAGVKDSGTLLPGHGGVLDRIDSLVSTLPVAAFLLAWIGAA